MSSIRVEPIGRRPMKATHKRVPRNLPPIKSVSPPITPPPEFDDRPETPRSTGRTPIPGSARLGLTPIRTPEIHSGRVLHEKGMPLLCKVRLKTLKEMKDRLKEWLPMTGERIEHLTEFKVIDSITASSFKRVRDTVQRWDMLIIEMDKNYENIAHVWNYVIQHVTENDKKTLQAKFHATVNKRFNVMLEPLQLNRRRQGNVGDLMMSAVHQTQEDMDSLSIELKTYKEFTEKLSQLTHDKETDATYVHDIQIVYGRLSGHIHDLEQEAQTANAELRKMKVKSDGLMSQLQSMKDKNTELQSQIEYFQKITMANAQLQLKNSELQEALTDIKRDIAMGQSLMMEEIRSMREENRLRAEQEHERVMAEFQDRISNAMTESNTAHSATPRERKLSHSHSSKHGCNHKK